jgi:three-Cys-motif partner protein
MSKKNNDFFVEKKPWSEVKDQLLGCYLKPYVTKILNTHKPLVYVDCFAGKGKFDDGKQGSPLIALEIMQQVPKSLAMSKHPQIIPAFIELNYADALRANLKDYPDVKIVSGAYGDTIDELLKNKGGCNVFLYIDPYGIKALNCSKFDKFAKGRFNSIELLINMNTFGFIREGCRVMGKQFTIDDNSFFDDLVEYEPTRLDTSNKSVEALNQIAGGDYWKSIIEQYISGNIDGYKAEEYFSQQYCQRLRQTFTYVLNMPIRIKEGQHTKYRMIHATNHPAGCLLMADNICNRWELMKQLQTGGQMPLFQETVDNQIIDGDEIQNDVIEHFSQFYRWTPLTETLALFFVKYGVICRSKDITEILRKLEKDKQIAVRREPSLTRTGKPSTFMTERQDQKVFVKWENQ